MTCYQFNASRTSSISNCFLLPVSLISIFTSHNHRKFEVKLSVLLILKPHHVQNTSATIPNLVKIERAPNYSAIEGITRKKSHSTIDHQETINNYRVHSKTSPAKPGDEENKVSEHTNCLINEWKTNYFSLFYDLLLWAIMKLQLR
jgi:hypothetical protein